MSNEIKVKAVLSLANELHDEAYGKRVGNVLQVWEDGEITCQKSGELLWLRTLWPVKPGFQGLNIPMPVKQMNGHSYAMVGGREEALKLRAEILKAPC